jgi:hypothetical protein
MHSNWQLILKNWNLKSLQMVVRLFFRYRREVTTGKPFSDRTHADLRDIGSMDAVKAARVTLHLAVPPDFS